MKYAILPLLLAIGTFSTASHAAPKQQPKRTFEYCNELATQRGLLANERGRGRQRFIAGCMSGKIQ